MITKPLTTTHHCIVGLAIAVSLLVGCSSGPEGPAQGSSEWYWQSAATEHEEGDFPDAIEELGYAAEGEGEWAQRAVVWHRILTVGLSRGNAAAAETCRLALEENADLIALVRGPMQQVQRDARQNIITFVEGLGDFESALGTGDVILDIPFPPGDLAEASLMASLADGQQISDVQLQAGIQQMLALGVMETVALMAGSGDDLVGAKATFEAGPVTVDAEHVKMIVAIYLVDMSYSFTKERMNEPNIRDVVLQRANDWIQSGLESENEGIKEQSEALRDLIEDERRDVKGLEPLDRDGD
jgi:hypothetical protein